MRQDVAYWDDVAAQTFGTEDELFRWSANFPKKRAIARNILRYKIGTKILEIGCGIASIRPVLLNLYETHTYVGTDLAYNFCEVSKNYFGASTCQAEIVNLPFQDNTFDSIFMFDMLEHIAPNQRQKGAEEIGRVSKSEATYFVVVPRSSSGHTDFDWGFADSEVTTLADVLGAYVAEMKILTATGRYYLWAVLGRDNESSTSHA